MALQMTDRPSVATPAYRGSRAFRWPIALVLGAAIVALSAQVAFPVPLSPVPMTLQGLAVILVGGLFGSAAAAGSMVLYLLAGAFGAPVFAFGTFGLAKLFGPSGGYLLSFPLAAAVVGRVAERGHLGRALMGALAGMVLIHLGGWAQLTLLGTGAERAFQLGVLPFVGQDLLKVCIGGLVLWQGHHRLRPRA